LSLERVALGLEEDPQPAARFLHHDAAPVHRDVGQRPGRQIVLDRNDRGRVVAGEAPQGVEVGVQRDVLHAEHGHGAGPEPVLHDRQQVVQPPGGHGSLREHDELELLEPLARPDQVEDRCQGAPLLLGIADGESALGGAKTDGDLRHQAVKVVPEREVEVDLGLEDLDHGPGLLSGPGAAPSGRASSGKSVARMWRVPSGMA
jgi:hypothetical protein